MSETADQLDTAADEVLKGWRQGDYGNYTLPEDDVCALGALARVNQVYNVVDVFLKPSVTALGGYLLESLSWPRGAPSRAIVEWNDAPGRTAGEVADAMRTCAKELREKGNGG